MIVTVLIMGIVAAAITEITVTQNVIAFRTFNKLDALINARRVVSFIERDIHNARFIGSQSDTDPNSYSGPPTYQLNAQTLIIQIPVFYASGSYGNISAVPTPTASGYWNVDTIIYQIVGDPDRAGTGQFLLQKTVYPGLHNNGYEPMPVILNQTILTGIAGPTDLTKPADSVAGTPPPKVFGFLSKQTPMYSQNFQPGVQPDATNINGVSINLEVLSNASSTRQDLTPRAMAFRTEVYVRGNYYSP